MKQKYYLILLIFSLSFIPILYAQTTTSVPSEIQTNSSQTCLVGSSIFSFKDIRDNPHTRCLEDYNAYGGLLSPQAFFIKERPSVRLFFVSSSDIDYNTDKTFITITDSNRNTYKPSLKTLHSFTNTNAGRTTYHVGATLKNVNLTEPIRVDYRITNLAGEVEQGYREDITSISISGIECRDFSNNTDKESGLNFFFLSNGYYEDEFSEFDNSITKIIKDELFATPVFNEYRTKINIVNIHNKPYVFTCSADYALGRLPCNSYDMISIAEASCNMDFSENDILTILTSTKIYNNANPSAEPSGNYVFLSPSSIPAFVHEIGHAFAGFSDEYIGSVDIFHKNYAPNLDLPGCQKWCSGVYDTSNHCYNFYNAWVACITPYLTDWQNHGNELRKCYQNISTQVEQTLGYPLNYCNIGSSCFEGTGCYMGALSMQMFRSMKESVMSGLSTERHNFGPYMEWHIREKIKRILPQENNETCRINCKEQQFVQIRPGRSYQSVSFSELETNPSIWNGEYITLYGYYEKSSNLFKESKAVEFGLKIAITSDCHTNGAVGCDLNTDWLSINGLFTYDSGYNLEANAIRLGKNVGNKCLKDNECQSNLCLLCPGMKMILAGYITYEDLPENAVKIDFSVTESGIVPEKHIGSITLINPAADYGYCAGGVLPTSGPDTQEYIDKVHQAYIDNNILELDEPFVWGPKTFPDDGGSGYCIGVWNNNKYKWVLTKPGDEKYLNLVKEALIQDVSDQYFNDYLELVSLNRHKEGSITYREDRKDIVAGFKYSIEEYNFDVNYDVVTHSLINDEWVETDESTFKSQVLSQQKIQEIENLLSKEDAFNKLKTECLLGLQETRIDLLRDGTVVMDGQQTISMEENKCKHGRLNLQTGEILECRESACYVTAPGESTYKPPTAPSTNIWIYILVGVVILAIIFSIILFRRKRL